MVTGAAMRGTSSIALSDNDNENEGSNMQKKINAFLDTPFFDPDAYIQEGQTEGVVGSFKAWFSDLVKNDYETAEALYAGVFFAILLVATQELLRMQIYGADYVPFSRGGGGSLW